MLLLGATMIVVSANLGNLTWDFFENSSHPRQLRPMPSLETHQGIQPKRSRQSEALRARYLVISGLFWQRLRISFQYLTVLQLPFMNIDAMLIFIMNNWLFCVICIDWLFAFFKLFAFSCLVFLEPTCISDIYHTCLMVSIFFMYMYYIFTCRISMCSFHINNENCVTLTCFHTKIFTHNIGFCHFLPVSLYYLYYCYWNLDIYFFQFLLLFLFILLFEYLFDTLYQADISARDYFECLS